MTRPRRSREQVVAETIGVLVGAVSSAVMLIVIFAELPILQRLMILVGAIVVYGGILLATRRRVRRRRGARPRLAKADRRLLDEALAGAGRLPAGADESWRPFLRGEVLGQSFIALWLQNAPLTIVVMVGVPVVTRERELAATDWPDLLVIIALGTFIAAAVAFGLVLYRRPRTRNALSMLDQLDARAAERTDA